MVSITKLSNRCVRARLPSLTERKISDLLPSKSYCHQPTKTSQAVKPYIQTAQPCNKPRNTFGSL